MYGFKPWRTQIKLYFWPWLEYEKLIETLDEWAAWKPGSG